jgi:hypothetical protein
MEKFGDSCILNTDWNEFFNSNEDKQISKMFYFDAESARGVKVTEPIIQTSDVFNQYFVESVVGCSKNRDPQKCQVLANLCVLSLYNENMLACKKFKQVQAEVTESPTVKTEYDGADNWKSQMPWIYYTSTP